MSGDVSRDVALRVIIIAASLILAVHFVFSDTWGGAVPFDSTPVVLGVLRKDLKAVSLDDGASLTLRTATLIQIVAEVNRGATIVAIVPATQGSSLTTEQATQDASKNESPKTVLLNSQDPGNITYISLARIKRNTEGKNGPTAFAQDKCVFAQGELVGIVGRDGKWIRCRGGNGQEGWIPSRYLSPLQVVVKSELDIYDSPRLTKSLGRMQAGSNLVILGRYGNAYLVQLSGETSEEFSWISASEVEVK